MILRIFKVRSKSIEFTFILIELAAFISNFSV